jgi:biopolymer transport protein ExbD
MKKCSHSAHDEVTQLNITPLLDLAFVLLVIFIITTTPIVNDLDVKLPTASKHEKDPPRKATYISIDAAGKIWIGKQAVEITDLQPVLAGLRVEAPDLSVIVRADAKTKYYQVRAALDACQQANVAKIDLATDPAPVVRPAN